MIIFLRLNSSFFSIFFNGHPLRLGKIFSAKTRNPETRTVTVPGWKNRYFLLLFSLLHAGLNGIVDCPESKSDHVVSRKKREKKKASQRTRETKELCSRECFHFIIDPFVSGYVDFSYLLAKLF